MHTAPSRLRDREAHIRTAFSRELTTLLHDQQRLQSEACSLTRLMTLIATITLAAAALFRSLSDFRMGVWIIVSGASATLVPSLSTGKRVWMLLVLGVVGVFTLFHWNQFSRAPISMLDMATLTVLAVSPIILANTRPLVLKHPAGKL